MSSSSSSNSPCRAPATRSQSSPGSRQTRPRPAAPRPRVVGGPNPCQPGGQEVSRKDFEHSIERKVDVILPFDPKTAAQAAKLGQPLAKVTQPATLSQPLNQ